jgi:Fic family protein
MAVGHYQFEAIRPFTDGNGRTGRVLNSLFLIDQELLELPILYLSRFFIKRRGEYYRLLLSVTRNAAWEEWILFALRGVEETAGGRGNGRLDLKEDHGDSDPYRTHEGFRSEPVAEVV